MSAFSVNRRLKNKNRGEINNEKRISAIFLIVAMLVGFCLPAFAATTMKLTGVTYPTTMKEGEPFVAKGVITSDYYIRKVVIGAYNSSGAAEFEYTGLPGEKTYNINNVDYLLYFSRLKSGSYTYKIVASDDNSSNVVLLNQKFTVSNGEQAASTLKLTNANYPTALDVGEGLSVTGVVSSNYNISKIVIGAYKSDGTKGFEQTVTPGAKSYDLSSIDALLTFQSSAWVHIHIKLSQATPLNHMLSFSTRPLQSVVELRLREI